MEKFLYTNYLNLFLTAGLWNTRNFSGTEFVHLQTRLHKTVMMLIEYG